MTVTWADERLIALRPDGRWEVANAAEADRRHGCRRDDWCILADRHAGDCNEQRDVL